MLFIKPTKRGLGVELWGTYDDYQLLYEVIGGLWNKDENIDKEGFENRDSIMSSFSYEIRKAYEGSRLTSEQGFYLFSEGKYYGCKISWVHFIFSLHALRYNTRYYTTNLLDLSVLMQLEFWLEKAMFSYDSIGAMRLCTYIKENIYAGNPYLYLYMRRINAQYFTIQKGKKGFRELPNLLKMACQHTTEYQVYKDELEKDAIRLNCNASLLEVSDDDVNYDVEW